MKDQKIKLPPEFRSGNSIPVERATITLERMVEILAEAVDPYIETLFKIGEHLGIDYQAARKAPGKPSDVYIAAIDADRQTTAKQFAAYKRLTESLESRLTLLQNQYDQLKKATDPSLLESERAANALLTEEVELLKAERQAQATLYATQYLSLTDAMGYESGSGLSPEEWAATLRADRQARGEPAAYPTRTGQTDGRLATRRFQVGDNLPAVGSYCLVSGANCDIESDQHRGYSWRQVLGYSDDKEFVCLQTHKDSYACWPTVERLNNCWFAEVPHPIDATQHPQQHPDDAAVDAFAAAMKAKLAKKRTDGRGGWQECSAEYLSELLRGHVEKGDPVDVANLAMMLHQNGQSIQPAAQPQQRASGWPKVNGVGRVLGSEQSLEVYFDSEPSDDQLRAVHNFLTSPQPQQIPEGYRLQPISEFDAMMCTRTIPEGYKLVPQRLINLCEQFTRWRNCMSYNDSYFGEPEGDLKRIAAEMEHAMLEAVPESKGEV